MTKLIKRVNYLRRKARVGAKLHGTSQRPRMAVFVSNLHVSAQLIDDDTGKTLVHATTVGSKAKGTLTEKAGIVGEQIAKKAQALKIKNAIFDRGGKLYHGRVKAVADSARKAGLEI
jgi:large subunit ribosomal protein L18